MGRVHFGLHEQIVKAYEGIAAILGSIKPNTDGNSVGNFLERFNLNRIQIMVVGLIYSVYCFHSVNSGFCQNHPQDSV